MPCEHCSHGIVQMALTEIAKREEQNIGTLIDSQATNSTFASVDPFKSSSVLEC